MAAYSLHRRTGSPYWLVSFRVPNPDAAFDPVAPQLRQCTRSTKQEKKSEAEKAARAIVDAAEKAAGAGTEKGRKIYEILTEAAQKAEAGSLNVSEGQRYLARMIEVAGGGEFKKYTIRAWLNEWLTGKTSEIAKPGKKARGKAFSDNTHDRYSAIVGHLLKWLPEEKANGSILALSAEDVTGWRDALAAEGRGASTVNLSIKILRAALNAAKDRGYLIANVTKGVPLLAETEPIRATFTLDHVESLLHAAEGEWKGVILAGYFTGASLGDIVRLRWQQVDLAAGSLTYVRRKTGAGVVMPIHEDLAAWLTATDDPTAYVFPELARRGTSGARGLSPSFSVIMKRAKITGETAKPKGKAGKTRNALSFHCLRHSFISGLANAGIGVEMRQALAGHASAEVNMIYTHREIAPLREAMKSLPGLNGTEEGGA
jgi:integrase